MGLGLQTYEEFINLNPTFKSYVHIKRNKLSPSVFINISHILYNERFGKRMDKWFPTTYYGLSGDLKELAKEKEIRKLMLESNSPFSLFGNYLSFTRYIENVSIKYKVDRRPMVVIPNVEDVNKIINWQNSKKRPH